MWEDKKSVNSYYDFTDNLMKKLSQVAVEAPVVMIVEPNSYGTKDLIAEVYKKTSMDTRQMLTDSQGRKMTPEKSRMITELYDRAYKEAAIRNGYRVIVLKVNEKEESLFYDAVHYTSKGARHIGEKLAKWIGNAIGNEGAGR